MSRFRNWWLGLPWPWWTLAACKPIAPWCLIDDLAHAWFPMTYGWSEICGETDVSHWPLDEPWICRMHERSAENYARKKNPEYFDDDQ